MTPELFPMNTLAHLVHPTHSLQFSPNMKLTEACSAVHTYGYVKLHILSYEQ